MVVQILAISDLKQRDGLVRLDFELLRLAVTKAGIGLLLVWWTRR